LASYLVLFGVILAFFGVFPAKAGIQVFYKHLYLLSFSLFIVKRVYKSLDPRLRGEDGQRERGRRQRERGKTAKENGEDAKESEEDAKESGGRHHKESRESCQRKRG